MSTEILENAVNKFIKDIESILWSREFELKVNVGLSPIIVTIKSEMMSKEEFVKHLKSSANEEEMDE